MEWTDTTKIILFRAGLSQAIKDRLEMQFIFPSTYSDFVATIKKLAIRGASSNIEGSRQGGVEPMQLGAMATVGTISIERTVVGLSYSDSDSD